MEIKMEASWPMTAEEAALKRNTDCVYFLASPLTCKKGNECEFRHSEGARVNPRDCWYWLNGNCTNPKCLFRHPPLDGLFATSGVPSGPALPTSQPVASIQMPAPLASGSHNASTQSVSCYYFLKGQCLKGDKCLFMHGLHPAGNPAAHQVANGPHPVGNHIAQQAKISTSFTGTSQTLSWSLKECTAQQNIPKPAVDNPVQILYSSAKSSNKAESVPNNGQLLNKTMSPRSPPIVAPVSSDSTPSRPRHRQSHPSEEHHQNGREGDEFLGGSSPGFDVIVDDDIGDSDHYHDEEFKRGSIDGERNPSHYDNDFNYNHSDFEPVASFGRGQFNGKGEYNRYERGYNQHGRDRPRVSSERTIDGPLMPKRRVAHRELSPHEVDGSDLRHRLLKQRRLSGSDSAVSHDYTEESRRRGDHYVADRYRDRSTGRDSRDGRDLQHLPRQKSISSRLGGRITLPVRSEPDRPIGSRSERNRERNRTRLSPIRRGRSRDGIRKRLNEDITADGRSYGGRSNTRDDSVGPLSFAGPKSLAELKGVKNSASVQEQPTKSVDAPLAPGYQASEDSFEGPKSLTTLLKRKSSGDKIDTRHPGIVSGSVSPSAAAVADNQILNSSAAAELEEGSIRTEGEELLITGQSSAEGTAVEVEEDGMIVDAAEDRDLENYDEDYDYEEVEGGDSKPDEDENAYLDEDNTYQEEEDLDDEDEFAKKVGAFFS